MKTTALFAAALALPMFQPAIGSARTFARHGTFCQATSSIGYSQFGAHNTAATAQSFECPFNLSYSEGANPTVTQAFTTVYDRSTTADVVCDLQKMDFSGNPLMTVTARSIGGGPGSASQTLNYTIPPSTFVAGFWRVRCTVPPPQSGAFSHVASSAMITSE